MEERRTENEDDGSGGEIECGFPGINWEYFP